MHDPAVTSVISMFSTDIVARIADVKEDLFLKSFRDMHVKTISQELLGMNAKVV